METVLNPPIPATSSSTNTRIKIIDVLRGFALFGIIINHIDMNFLAGMPPPENITYNILSPIDAVFSQYNVYLTFGKFYTIFSFLFGLSFAIQMESAFRKGVSFTGRFVWRLITLFIIGYVHNLLFSGDILIIYAVLGLFLILFQKASNKVLLIVSAFLILNLPLMVFRVFELFSPPAAEQLEAQQLFMAEMGKEASANFKIKSSGTLGQLVSMNYETGLFGKFLFQVFTGRLWITFGLFLLGLYAGRKKIFEDNSLNRYLFRKIFFCSFFIALFSTIISVMYGQIWGSITSWWDLVGLTAFDFHQASLTAFYVAGIVLLYWKTRASQFLDYLAPVGQMGLTTYLSQSVFGILIFFGVGLGMMGNMGSATAIGIGVLFYIVQIMASRLWLAHYKMGPVEWLWRAVTYFKMPPFRKSSAGGEALTVS